MQGLQSRVVICNVAYVLMLHEEKHLGTKIQS